MSRYDGLIKEYLADLAEAREKALLWWDRLAEKETELAGSRKKALEALGMRWQVGPVSHPYVIAVYRAYYLKVIEMNEQVEAQQDLEENAAPAPEDEASWGREDEEGEEEETVDPAYLLRHDLNFHDEVLYEFMQPLVFLPIGLDPDDRFV